MGSIILAFDGKFGPLYANVFASASLLVGTIITGIQYSVFISVATESSLFLLLAKGSSSLI